MIAALPTLADYDAAFYAEQAQHYPAIDAFEIAHGFALERERLEEAARILACPVKANPPNWQHGRVLYALTRAYLAPRTGPFLLVDIGTAKGFSALCLRWALDDERVEGVVISTDVLDPGARVRRNTVAEIGGHRTLAELLLRWPETHRIVFRQGTGSTLIDSLTERVHVAFLDGKHSTLEVTREVAGLRHRQEPGDLVVFDDVHLPAVNHVVERARAFYAIETVIAKPGRWYAIGVRQ